MFLGVQEAIGHSFEPHYESEAKYKAFSFNSYANKTNFHMKTFALSLASVMRFNFSAMAY